MKLNYKLENITINNLLKYNTMARHNSIEMDVYEEEGNFILIIFTTIVNRY